MALPCLGLASSQSGRSNGVGPVVGAGQDHVAAYQCRNPPHTAHEYLQRCTLDREDVDGLFIHPVVGRLKKGDYKPEVILACYEALVENYYPKDRVLLSSHTATMRYAGPNAALFYAIVRKNYGCDRYIVGRDQAGVGKYYDPFACHRIFDELPIDILPLRYPETFFCRKCAGMATTKTCAHPVTERVSTSQTMIRQKLKACEYDKPLVQRLTAWLDDNFIALKGSLLLILLPPFSLLLLGYCVGWVVKGFVS